MGKNNPITIEAVVNVPMATVWEYWTNPKHISGWAFASDGWEASGVENDLKVGGTFKTRMQSKGESEGFDFGGTYTAVTKHELIEYDMEKAPHAEKSRHVKVVFEETPEGVKIIQTFDPENENTLEMQSTGWQAILDNFKKYTESL